MPKVSGKRLLEKKKMDQLLEDLWVVVASLDTKEEAYHFFYDLLTHTERKMLAKRLRIAMMLIVGHDYETIKEEIVVSNTTITRVNNWLKTGAEGLTKAARILIDFKKESEEPLIERDGRKYLAGDLLLPAIEVGSKLVARKLRKHKRNKLLRK